MKKKFIFIAIIFLVFGVYLMLKNKQQLEKEKIARQLLAFIPSLDMGKAYKMDKEYLEARLTAFKSQQPSFLYKGKRFSTTKGIAI